MNYKNIVWGLCGLFGVIASSCQDYQGDILPDNLVCEYQTNPQAIDSPTPRLEWFCLLMK